jgi:hypothetical protein
MSCDSVERAYCGIDRMEKRGKQFNLEGLETRPAGEEEKKMQEGYIYGTIVLRLQKTPRVYKGFLLREQDSNPSPLLKSTHFAQIC